MSRFCVAFLMTINQLSSASSPSELCSQQGGVSINGRSVNPYNRSICLQTGVYQSDENKARISDSKGFFTYTAGRWEKTDAVDSHDFGNGWRWVIPGRCALVPFHPKFFCETFKLLTPRNGSDTKLLFVGDSIVGGQLQALWLSSTQLRNTHYKDPSGHLHGACGVTIKSVRSDHFIAHDKRHPSADWINELCASDVAVINYGAHAMGVEMFEATLKNAAHALTQSCGDAIKERKIRVFFRTTPEGNPWCNSGASAPAPATMLEWSNVTWRILSGEIPPPDPGLYKLQWHWSDFQLYNEIASNLLTPLGIKVIDVVPMTRLRPPHDWGQRPGKKLDCLHGNAAVAEWNTLILNSIAADVCS